MPSMAKDPSIQLHIRAWREARGLTQQQLADAVGRDKSVISKLERGLSGLTDPVLRSIAVALGIHPGALYTPPPEGTGPVGPDVAGQVGSILLPGRGDAAPAGPLWGQPALVGDRPDLPVYASAEGGSTGMTVDFNPIDWVKRPEPLFNVKAGFAMYVVGDSMEPAYRQGDMILVHPHRPANQGDDVLVVKADGNGRHDALIKQLVSVNDDGLRVRQWNPARDFVIPRREVFAVYVVVGRYNRR